MTNLPPIPPRRPTVSTLFAMAAALAVDAGGEASPVPEPPPPARPRGGYAPIPPRAPYPPPPREPTRDELLAIEKRKRKASKRQKGQR